jgi:iron(III) transport system substrate-binding protein
VSRLERRAVLAWGAGLAAGAPGCRRASGSEVVVYCSVDQVFAEPVLRAFEAASGVRVRAVFDTEETKSTGVVNRLLAEGANPQCDVFWSGDPVRPFLLERRGLIEPYLSPQAAGLPLRLRAADGTWTGIAARARVLLLHKASLGAGPRPASVKDLALPAWKGRAALANPLFGTTTMHMAALASTWGDERLQAFLGEVKANGVRVASSNGEVKRLVVAGEVAFGLTDTDDAAEAVKEGAPVEVVYPDQEALGALVMPSSVVRIRKNPHDEPAKKLIDALLSADTERRMAEAGAHMPLRGGVPVPSGVRGLSEVRAMTVDFSVVADAMERLQPWLKRWVGL